MRKILAGCSFAVAICLDNYSYAQVVADDFNLVCVGNKSKSFYVMQVPVTQGLYLKVTGENPSYFSYKEDCPKSFVELSQVGRNGLCPYYPVESVSYKDIINFIKLVQVHYNLFFSLPTTDDWNLLRGKKSQYQGGALKYGVFYQNSVDGAPRNVGNKRLYSNDKNSNGIYDVIGNVWEWTSTNYHKFGSKDAYKVIRGGSSIQKASMEYLHKKLPFNSSMKSHLLGFRLVLKNKCK